MQIWQNGKLSHIFNNKNNNPTEALVADINWGNQIIGFNITETEKSLPIILPLFIYFLNIVNFIVAILLVINPDSSFAF
jgi:hypothetical protein